MTPERAASILGPFANVADLTVTCRTDKHQGHWVVTATIGDERRPITSSPSLYLLTRWVARFKELL